MSKKEEEMADEEKKDSAKPGKEKEVSVQGNTIQTVLCVLVALAAFVFAIFLGYNNAL